VTRLIPTVFLDRDGVLNVDHGYVHRADQLEWVEGALDALVRLNHAGFQLIVVTNQAGIGRGYYTEATMHAFHAHLDTQIQANGARIAAYYFCPFHKDAKLDEYRHPDHPDRKPNPGMLLRAMKEQDVDPAASFMIGDKDSDVAAAKAAGIPGFHFTAGSLDKFVANILETWPRRDSMRAAQA
jgi:D-glycero-D-manno-heptose 1,7-bisphosphate phosphatase